MRAGIIGLALLWGIAAHAQQPAPTKTTELQARSYVLTAFVTGAAPLIMGPSVVITPALRERLRLPPDGHAGIVYDAMVDVTSAAQLQVRPARAEEIVKAGAKSEFRKPLFAMLAGETIFVVQYDLDRDHVIFAGDASAAPPPPAPIVERPVPASPPAPTIAIPVPTPPPAPPPAPIVSVPLVTPPAPPPAPAPTPPPAAAVAAPTAAVAAPAPKPEAAAARTVVEPKVPPIVTKPAPAPVKQASAAPVPKPAAPAPRLAPAGPCVIKPVMSEQDMANCAQRDARSARSTPDTRPQPVALAAAAPAAPMIAPAAKECVIKPVMSEEDIAVCAKRESRPAQAAAPAPRSAAAPTTVASAPARSPEPRPCVIKPVMSQEDMAACAKHEVKPLPPEATAPLPQAAAPAPRATAMAAPAPRQCVIKPVMSQEDMAVCAKQEVKPLPPEATAPLPQAAARPAATPPAPRPCVVKPVMSEEDLAACRR